MFILFWLVLHLIKCHAQTTTLKILSESTISLVQKGSNFTITCQATDLQDKTIRWKHNRREIALVANGNNIVYLEPKDRSKYSLSGGSSDGGNFTFTIHDIALDDISDVLCEVNGVEPVSHQIDVIRYPKDIEMTAATALMPFEKISQDSEVLIGFKDWVNVSCSVRNTRPSATIRWIGNFTGELLTLNQTQEESITMNGKLFNTTGFLYLPPGFYMFFSPTLGEVDVQSSTEAVTPNTTSGVAATTQAEVTAINSDQRIDMPKDSPNVETNLQLTVAITCQVEIENKLFSKTLIVHIGEHNSTPSSAVLLSPAEGTLLGLLFTALLPSCVWNNFI